MTLTDQEMATCVMRITFKRRRRRAVSRIATATESRSR